MKTVCAELPDDFQQPPKFQPLAVPQIIA